MDHIIFERRLGGSLLSSHEEIYLFSLIQLKKLTVVFLLKRWCFYVSVANISKTGLDADGGSVVGNPTLVHSSACPWMNCTIGIYLINYLGLGINSKTFCKRQSN